MWKKIKNWVIYSGEEKEMLKLLFVELYLGV